MLEVDHIGVAYGAAPALWDVNLHIDAGEMVCVVGPNGAGKTTLIYAIAGLHPISSGDLRMDGASIARLAPHKFCDLGIAIVPEGRRLFTGMTVQENLELGAYRKDARVHRAESMERVQAMFPILKERSQQLAGTLSGGQQQALAIGRALMAKPKLLLLDEPSLGLSPAIVLDLFKMVREIGKAGVAVLLVEQNVSMALDLAARAYVLEEGRIVAEGPSKELMERPEIKRAYLGI
jgi:branched-chain amino acid transport system ATP-binding protein